MAGFYDLAESLLERRRALLEKRQRNSAFPEDSFIPSTAKEELQKRFAAMKRGGTPELLREGAQEMYENPVINTTLAALPYSGDVMNASDVLGNLQEGNYLKAGLGAGLGALPFYGAITKNIKPETLETLGKYFDKSALEAIQAPLDYKGRETTVLMSPDEFLAYAARTTPNKRKMADIEKKFAEGKKIGADNLPFLQFDTEGGVSSITGHEGRHRAHYLKQQGVDLMPVNVKSSHIRWSEQADPNRFDYVQDWPQTLQNQDLTMNTPFPVTREGEYISSMSGKQALEDQFWRKQQEAPKAKKEEIDALAREFEDYYKNQ